MSYKLSQIRKQILTATWSLKVCLTSLFCQKETPQNNHRLSDQAINMGRHTVKRQGKQGQRIIFLCCAENSLYSVMKKRKKAQVFIAARRKYKL